MHEVPLISRAAYSGHSKAEDRKTMDEQPVDILVSTFDRYLHLKEKQKLFLSQVKTLVIDELDTLMDGGQEVEVIKAID